MVIILCAIIMIGNMVYRVASWFFSRYVNSANFEDVDHL